MMKCFRRRSQTVAIKLVLLANTEFTDRRNRMNCTEVCIESLRKTKTSAGFFNIVAQQAAAAIIRVVAGSPENSRGVWWRNSKVFAGQKIQTKTSRGGEVQ
ncbi:hypothetical protein L1987_45666 [Smallanthus sonchifolius]|uniref:Uncharacterized protein n=1 Tax=Smallanthus sonchifolius TaxID=185202 RepID=A0ACB9FYM1_9ASTR|nr:hypothetical protein L1987_45666 [Smallanthus sonchifolius]